MALSGTFNQYETSQFGLYCEWFGKPNDRTNSTSVTVDVYLRYYSIVTGECDGTIVIGEFEKAFKSPAVDDMTTNAWTNVLIGSYTADIAHDANGVMDNLTMSVSWDFNSVYNSVEISTITATTTESLNRIPVYALTVESDEYSTVTVNRVSSGAGTTGVLPAGAILYAGDRLRIYFNPMDDYQVVTHTVNNFTFASGGTLIVDGAISVVCYSQQIIRQSFAPENMQCFDADGETLHALYQWDKNVSIIIKDVAINPPPVFQFANRHAHTSIDVRSSVSGEDLVVTIPNELLERPEAIFAYVCRSSGTSLRTLGSIYIPVYARVRPGDSEYTNEQEVKQ